MTILEHIYKIYKKIKDLGKKICCLNDRLDSIESETPTLISGVYTPVITDVLNVDTAVAEGDFMYIRVGDIVTVSGLIAIDPTATGQTQVRISLPIPSNFGSTADLAGVANNHVIQEGASIFADQNNDEALIDFDATASDNASWSFTFTYNII